jgi:hypothetical protein
MPAQYAAARHTFALNLRPTSADNTERSLDTTGPGATSAPAVPARFGEKDIAGAPMQAPEPPHANDAGRKALLAAVTLQDNLMVASNDLDRLQRLLDDASVSLLGHFTGAAAQIEAALQGPAGGPHGGEAGAMLVLRQTLGSAITALQFQDMASQLISHTTRRLRHCADQLARDAMDDDEDGVAAVAEAPLRPNPVTQDEMDAGSVELF